MLRICGASAQRDALSAKQCWCGGLFCYGGGGKRSTEFRRQFKQHIPARSYDEFLDLIQQNDLFDGGAARATWIARVESHTIPKKGKGHPCRTTANAAR